MNCAVGALCGYTFYLCRYIGAL